MFFCALNFTGSWADGTLIAWFLPHMLKRVGNYKTCVDQEFPRSGAAWNVLESPVSDQTARCLHPQNVLPPQAC